MEGENSEDLLAIYKVISENSAYSKNSNIRMTSITDTGAVGEMILGPELTNENLDLHGGALYTLADTVTATAAYVWGVRHHGPGFSYTTASSSFNYLRPTRICSEAVGHRVIGTATLRKTGCTLCVIDVCITSECGVELCRGTFTGCFINMERYRREKPENTSA